jgi:LysR family transcriptional regulator, low CO2-responsive transcriptional regulator
MRHVTVRQLQVFVAAANALSFARVAERLRLSPAAISFQIKQVETMTGFALFERMGKRVALTDAGRALLGYAKTVLQALQDADQTLTALKGLTGGRVTVGLVSTATYFVPHMLARFQGRYPTIAIHLRDGNRQQIIEAMTKGEIDLAIMGQPPEGVDVSAEAFAPHPSVVVAPPGHPLVGRAGLAPKLLSDQPFIIREEGSGTRMLTDRFFREVKLAPRVVMVSSSNEVIKQAVMAGMGLALLSRHTVGLELGLGRIATLGVEGLPLMRSWFVGHRRGMPLLPAHQRLRAFFLEEGRAIIEELTRSYEKLGREKSSRPRRKT